jgi:hypothetical protein
MGELRAFKAKQWGQQTNDQKNFKNKLQTTAAFAISKQTQI